MTILAEFAAPAIGAGFVFGASLIFSIGPQNLRLIEAGAQRRHATSVATAGYLSEIIIVTAGVFGIGASLSPTTIAGEALRLAGIGFLVWCALRALRSAGQRSLDGKRLAVDPGMGAAIRSMLAVTWLNPLVYVEVMLLVGVLASNYGSEARIWFTVGFLCASALRFYGWCWAGSRLSRLISDPGGRRSFDRLSGLMLFATAGLLTLQIARG